MEDRIENNYLIIYIYWLCSEKLETCELFTKTFGPNYAGNQLRKNVLKVYSDVEDYFRTGCYNVDEKSITIYRKRKI